MQFLCDFVVVRGSLVHGRPAGIFSKGEIFKGGNLKLMARGLTITKHRSVNTLICFKVILIVS